VSKSEAPICGASVASELGHTPLRRLTRFEYGRTLEDLAGVDAARAAELPPDEKSLGFDDIADAHSISALHVSKYLEIADEVANSLVSDRERLRAFAGCDPLDDAECTEPFVRSFGRRAFRRALSDDELSAFVGLFETASEPGPSEGLTAVVSALLQSPQFLYRVEPGLGGDFGPALASRLAYLITASAPDAELLARAETGELAEVTELMAQADRLFDSPRAAEAFAHFVVQWWNLDELSSLEKDRNLYRAWTAALPAAFARETRQFIDAAWQSGPTLSTFLSAPYTYADADLAGFYGFEAKPGRGYERVTPRAGRASGLLTQGAFLATNAKANQTSPVLRGKFVRERLFCMPTAPPPPDVVVRPPVVDPRLSTRERFAAHTAEPRCAACHALMDPVGFSFEHYDASGRYRDTDAGKPVDASGELRGTDVDRKLDGLPSLAQALLASEQVQSCVATQWFRYAFGRQETPSHADGCAVATLSTALAQNNGDLRAAMRATVSSALFREQRREESSP
jgi:hypothetical protein